MSDPDSERNARTEAGQGTGDPPPPGQGTGDPSPPGQGTGDPPPPGQGTGDPPPPGQGTGDPPPPGGGDNGDQPPPDAADSSEGPVERVTRENPKIALALYIAGTLAVLIPILVVVLSPKGTLLERLSDTSYARGLITFVFTIGTIGIAILLVNSALSARGDDVKGRFDRGKEIFTALVGILGTILGFYFGQVQEPEAGLDVTSPRILETVRTAGAEVNLLASAFGGEPPYVYSLEFSPGVEREGDGTWDNLVVSDNLIVQKIKLPTVDSATTLVVKLRIRDTSGKQAESVAEIPIVAVETPGGGDGGDPPDNSQGTP